MTRPVVSWLTPAAASALSAESKNLRSWIKRRHESESKRSVCLRQNRKKDRSDQWAIQTPPLRRASCSGCLPLRPPYLLFSRSAGDGYEIRGVLAERSQQINITMCWLPLSQRNEITTTEQDSRDATAAAKRTAETSNTRAAMPIGPNAHNHGGRGWRQRRIHCAQPGQANGSEANLGHSW